MLVHGIILIVAVAIPLTLLTFVTEDYFRKVTTCGISIVLWLAAAAGSPQMSIPYTKIFENAADNSYQIIKGVHQISGAVSWLAWVWFGMAIMMVIYLFATVGFQGEKEFEQGMKYQG